MNLQNNERRTYQLNSPETKRFVTWNEVNEFVEGVKKLYDNGFKDYIGVYGVPRGGLVLAVMISHKLHLPLLMSPSPGCLIVDDIADSGKTLLHYSLHQTENAPEDSAYYDIVTLVYKPGGQTIPNYYLITKEENTWVVFPWETDDWEQEE